VLCDCMLFLRTLRPILFCEGLLCPCSPATSAARSTASGTPSGQAASRTRSKSLSRSRTCCSSNGSTTSTRSKRTRRARLKKPIKRRVFPEGKDSRKRPYEDFRWSRFKNFEPKDMFEVVDDHVFPFLQTLGGDDSTYAHHMKDARFTIPTPALPAKVVDMIDHVPMEDRDTKGDLYEYMLGKIASAGQNGQFRTPRHIIQLMVEMTAPGPKDLICDPACGTAGFLVTAGEFVRKHHPEVLRDAKL